MKQSNDPKPKPKPSPSPNLDKAVIDYSDTKVIGANYCRMHSTTEEFVLDFGITGLSQNRDIIAILATVMMSPATAKRVLLSLNHLMKNHEDAKGEVDVQF